MQDDGTVSGSRQQQPTDEPTSPEGRPQRRPTRDRWDLYEVSSQVSSLLQGRFTTFLRRTLEDVRAGSGSDPNLVRHARDAFESLSELLAEEVGREPRDVLPALLKLAGERDPEVTGSPEPPTAQQDVVAALADMPLRAKMQFERTGKRRYQRTIECLYIHQGQPVRALETSNVAWHDLPAEVRKDRILKDERMTTYVLFSEEEES